MAVAAFQKGLSRDGSRATRKLLSRLMKNPLITWDEIHNAYCAEVRADEDDLNGPTQRLTSVQIEPIKEQRDNIRRDHPVSRPNRERHQPYVRGAATPSPRYEEGPSKPSTRTHQNERDLFAFSHEDMSGIPREIAIHKLNVDPFHPLVRQVRRKFNSAINEEAEKLLENGSIRESKYHKWIVNVVMVKKKNGYNQILMEEEDQEKTTLITHQGIYYYMVISFELKNAELHIKDCILRWYGMKLNPEKYVFGIASGTFLGVLVSQQGIEVNPDQIKAIEGILELLTTKKQVQRLTGRITALSRFISWSSDRCHKFFGVLKKDNDLDWTPECVQALRELNPYLSEPPLLSKPEPR
nr:uncharacterized protein LOC104107672 [Nicotiana tomentosiformis]